MKTIIRTILPGIFLLSFIPVSILQAQSEFNSNVIGVGVVVSNLEKSLDFYTNVIGMKETGGFDLDGDFGKKSGLTDGLPLKVHILQLEDNPEAASWKLLSYGKNAPDPLPRYVEDIVGMRYITIQVAKLRPFLDRIEKHKIELMQDEPMPLSGGRYLVLVRDPDGILIELIGPMD